MFLRKSIFIICYIALYYGCWYTFEFINPWIGIIAAILITALLIDGRIKIIKK